MESSDNAAADNGYDPNNARHVVSLLNDEMDGQLRSTLHMMEAGDNGLDEWITWLGIDLWDTNDHNVEALPDTGGDEVETIEACVRRRFMDALSEIRHLSLRIPTGAEGWERDKRSTLSVHAGDDYVCALSLIHI